MKLSHLIATLIIALSVVIFPFALYYGNTVMVVSSDSMLPILKPYDMIVVKPVKIEEIKVGDIIAFRVHLGDIDIVAHRVVEIVEDEGEKGLKTRGDNVEYNDEWIVHGSDLVGKVVNTVPSLGFLLINPVRYAIITFTVILAFSILWELSKKGRLSEKTKS